MTPHIDPDVTPTSMPMGATRRGPKTAASHGGHGAQPRLAGGADIPDAKAPSLSNTGTRLGADTAAPATKGGSVPIQVPSLALLDDTLVSVAAAVLDDTERVLRATENRLRALTTPIDRLDKNGNPWGQGLALDHPDLDLTWLEEFVVTLRKNETTAATNLRCLMRQHPLRPWIKSQVGIGDKQAARLLAAIGDPYWHTKDDRPRTVSELWSYCGYKPGQKRRRGETSNWSADAKTRAFLIAEKCIQFNGVPDKNGKPRPLSPYRAVYDNRRAHTAITHPEWTLAHLHNDALRIVSKEILKDLWRAARDIHHAAETEEAA